MTKRFTFFFCLHDTNKIFFFCLTKCNLIVNHEKVKWKSAEKKVHLPYSTCNATHKEKSFRCNPNFLWVNILRWGSLQKILVTSFYELHLVIEHTSHPPHIARYGGGEGGWEKALSTYRANFSKWLKKFAKKM